MESHPANTASLVIFLIINVLVCLSGGTYIYAVLKQDRGKFKSTNELIMFILVSSQVTMNFVYIPVNCCVLAWGGYVGNGGATLCNIDAIITLFATGLIIASHVALGLERFIVMTNVIEMSNVLLWSIFAIVALSMDWIIVYRLTQGGTTGVTFALYESGSYCIFPATGDMGARVSSAVQVAIGVVYLNIIIMAYGHIFLKIQKTSNQMKSTTNSLKKGKTESENVLRSVLIRCMALVGCLIILWTPFSAAMLYRAITNQQISPILSDISCYMVIADGIMNPLIMLWTNKKQWAAYQHHVLGRTAVTATSSSGVNATSQGSRLGNTTT